MIVTLDEAPAAAGVESVKLGSAGDDDFADTSPASASSTRPPTSNARKPAEVSDGEDGAVRFITLPARYPKPEKKKLVQSTVVSAMVPLDNPSLFSRNAQGLSSDGTGGDGASGKRKTVETGGDATASAGEGAPEVAEPLPGTPRTPNFVSSAAPTRPPCVPRLDFVAHLHELGQLSMRTAREIRTRIKEGFAEYIESRVELGTYRAAELLRTKQPAGSNDDQSAAVYSACCPLSVAEREPLPDAECCDGIIIEGEESDVGVSCAIPLLFGRLAFEWKTGSQ